MKIQEDPMSMGRDNAEGAATASAPELGMQEEAGSHSWSPGA